MADQNTPSAAPVSYPVPAAGVIGNRVVRDISTARATTARRNVPKVAQRPRALPKGR